MAPFAGGIGWKEMADLERKALKGKSCPKAATEKWKNYQINEFSFEAPQSWALNTQNRGSICFNEITFEKLLDLDSPELAPSACHAKIALQHLK